MDVVALGTSGTLSSFSIHSIASRSCPDFHTLSMRRSTSALPISSRRLPAASESTSVARKTSSSEPRC